MFYWQQENKTTEHFDKVRKVSVNIFSNLLGFSLSQQPVGINISYFCSDFIIVMDLLAKYQVVECSGKNQARLYFLSTVLQIFRRWKEYTYKGWINFYSCEHNNLKCPKDS